MVACICFEINGRCDLEICELLRVEVESVGEKVVY